MAHLLAKTAVDSGGILHACCGRFLSLHQDATLLARIATLEVLLENEPGVLTSVHKQSVHDKILNLTVLKSQGLHASESSHEVLDKPVVLLESQRVAITCFDANLCRFIRLQVVDLHMLGMPVVDHSTLLVADERGQGLALAAHPCTIFMLHKQYTGSQGLLLDCTAPTELFEADTLKVVINDMCFLGAYGDEICLAVALSIQSTDPALTERQPARGHFLQMFRIHGEKLAMFQWINLQHACLKIIEAPWPTGLLCIGLDSLVHVDLIWPAPTSTLILDWAHEENAPNDAELAAEHWGLKGAARLSSLGLKHKQLASCWTRMGEHHGLLLMWMSEHRLRLVQVHLQQGTPVAAGPVPLALDMLPGRIPNSLVRLPSGAMLLVPQADDALVLQMDPNAAGLTQQPAVSKVTQVLQSWLPIQDATSADLAGLGQPQVYAVSGTSPTASGSLHVLHGSQVVDTLFQSAPDYQGVTGLWAIPMTPTEVCAALIIISFASGSRAMTAGSTLSDVTESIGLDANAQTLAAGSVADLAAAQVTSRRVVFFRLQSLISMPGLSKSQRVPAASDEVVRPRKRSTPPVDEAERSVSSSEDSGTRWGVHSGFMEGPRSSCDSTAEHADALSSMRLNSSHEVRPEGLVWQPPGGASISCACVKEGLVLVSCAQLRTLTALMIVQSERSSTSPGAKRKRQSPDWHAADAASTPMPAELSCIHATDAPSGCASGGGWICIGGTYEPAIELLLLERDFAGGAAAWRFQRLLRLQEELLSTSLFPSDGASSSSSEDRKSVV